MDHYYHTGCALAVWRVWQQMDSPRPQVRKLGTCPDRNRGSSAGIKTPESYLKTHPLSDRMRIQRCSGLQILSKSDHRFHS